MLSLTYSFDVDKNSVQLNYGDVSIPDMSHFYPQGEAYGNISMQDEKYAAHMYVIPVFASTHTNGSRYGALSYTYGTNTSDNYPKANSIYQPSYDMLFQDYDSKSITYPFSDSPDGEEMMTAFSVYTSRKINVTYRCNAYPVLNNGNGTETNIVIESGNRTVSQTVPNSITYLARNPHICEDNFRCSIVEAFESSSTDPWYYQCNITLGSTQNDPLNVSFVSDYMARIATASIAHIGYTDYLGVASQIYPQDSMWGTPQNGSADDIGMTVATFAMGAIAGATLYNPFTTYPGLAPSQGVILHVGHPYFFYLIIGLICGCHLIFIVVVAVLTNRVMVGPDGHLSMSLLLRPIADALNGVSGGKENRAFRDAKRNTTVVYERGRNGQRWVLNMVDR